MITSTYLEDCFYEKRLNTTLNGYNDLHDRWISEFDCFNHCLRIDSEQCRSFEHWRQRQYGLCIRANISLTDYPSLIRSNEYVDYYEINCREDIKAVKPSEIHCPDDQLFLTVKLNDIDPYYLLLGDTNCKPNWANETHAHFITHIDNCSLMLTNDSIIGKLRWEIVSEGKNYERFFTCLSNIYQIRLNHRTSATATYSNSRTIFPHPHNHQIGDDERQMSSSNRINLEWTLQNRSYFCPKFCFISLYSFINITLADLSLISSRIFIDSCDLKALPPYTNYLQSTRLISQGCSIDPTVIHAPQNASSLSLFYFSFYLYHILKEPIPFEIQCKVLHDDEKNQIQHNIDCSSFTDNNHLSRTNNNNNKRDYSYTLFRSLSIHVTRQLPLLEYEQKRFHNQNSMISIATSIMLSALFMPFLFLYYI